MAATPHRLRARRGLSPALHRVRRPPAVPLPGGRPVGLGALGDVDGRRPGPSRATRTARAAPAERGPAVAMRWRLREGRARLQRPEQMRATTRSSRRPAPRSSASPASPTSTCRTAACWTVGHICEAYDLNVRHLAENALDPVRGHADRDLQLRFPGLIGRGGRGRLRAELSSPGRDRLAAIPPAGGIAPRSAPVGLLLEIVEGVLRPTDG